MDPNKKHSPLAQSLIVGSVVGFYWVISISLVFANKWVMKTYDFNYPLFMTWAQLVIAEVFILVLAFLSSSIGGIFSFYPGLEWDWKIALNVLPLTLIWLGMMAASNICLRYTEVTFYQVVRGLTILWSLCFQQYQFPEFVVGTERSIACFIVIVGFISGSYGEMNFNWPGFFSGLISSMLVAYYNNQIKKALIHVDGNSWRLMLYNTTIGVVICVPVLYLTGELVFNDAELLERFVSKNILIGTLGCGILGYLINFAIFLQIQMTSPLTGTISGTVKAGVQALLGWLIFRNEISSLNLAGILLVLGGSGYYSWVGYKAMQNKGKEEAK